MSIPALGNALTRDNPYIYATWIAKLMSGEHQCSWAAWFKAHYTHDKLPPRGSLEGWQANHNDLLQRRREKLVRDGFRVFVEAQNKFTLPSKDGRISIGGKIDIIAVNPSTTIIEECKTGLPRNSDLLQLLIYMLLGPFALENCRKPNLQGRLVYPDKVMDVPAARVTDAFKTRFKSVVERIGADAPPDFTPSLQECGWCNIGSVYCDARIESHQDETVEHDAF